MRTLRDSYGELLDCIETEVQPTDPVSDLSPAGWLRSLPRFSAAVHIVVRYR